MRNGPPGMDEARWKLHVKEIARNEGDESVSFTGREIAMLAREAHQINDACTAEEIAAML
jgi:hypothetical protein